MKTSFKKMWLICGNVVKCGKILRGSYMVLKYKTRYNRCSFNVCGVFLNGLRMV